LGRVIERITGTSYEKFLQEKVLARIGIRQMRIGASLADKRGEGEVRYYTPHDETAESVFDSPPSDDAPSGAQKDGESRNPSLTPPKKGNPVAEPSRQVSSQEGSATGERRTGKQVPWPYGVFCLESMDAHGGWIASAIDLARFAATLHDAEHNPLLKPETI